MVKIVLVGVEGAEDFVAILLKNIDPHVGVAGGDPGGVAQTVTGQLTPLGRFTGKSGAEIGRDYLRQVTDVGDDFVVLVRIDGDHFTAEVVPETDNEGDAGLGSIRGGRDEAGASFKEGLFAILPASESAASHGMGSDEDRVRRLGREGGMGVAANLGLHTAHVGDQRSPRKMRSDPFDQAADTGNGGGNDDQIGRFDGGFGGFSHLVAPGLVSEFEANFGATRPDDNTPGSAASVSSLSDGTAKKTGSQNDKGIDHSFGETACEA